MITILPDDNSNPLILPDSALFGSDKDIMSKALSLLNNPPKEFIDILNSYKNTMVALQKCYKDFVTNRNKDRLTVILALTINLEKFCK